MAEPKKTAGGTAALPDSPELTNLKEREKAFVDEIARLDAMNANKANQGGHDINEVKRRAQQHLAEVRKEIQAITK